MGWGGYMNEGDGRAGVASSDAAVVSQVRHRQAGPLLGVVLAAWPRAAKGQQAQQLLGRARPPPPPTATTVTTPEAPPHRLT